MTTSCSLLEGSRAFFAPDIAKVNERPLVPRGSSRAVKWSLRRGQGNSVLNLA